MALCILHVTQAAWRSATVLVLVQCRSPSDPPARPADPPVRPARPLTTGFGPSSSCFRSPARTPVTPARGGSTFPLLWGQVPASDGSWVGNVSERGGSEAPLFNSLKLKPNSAEGAAMGWRCSPPQAPIGRGWKPQTFGFTPTSPTCTFRTWPRLSRRRAGDDCNVVCGNRRLKAVAVLAKYSSREVPVA